MCIAVGLSLAGFYAQVNLSNLLGRTELILVISLGLKAGP